MRDVTTEDVNVYVAPDGDVTVSGIPGLEPLTFSAPQAAEEAARWIANNLAPRTHIRTSSGRVLLPPQWDEAVAAWRKALSPAWVPDNVSARAQARAEAEAAATKALAEWIESLLEEEARHA